MTIHWRAIHAAKFNKRKIIKMKLIPMTAALISCGASGLIAWAERLADESQIIRAKAYQVMCHAYGQDWQDTLIASETTNRVQLRAMLDTYRVAIGLPPAL
jgi:hypothetical protein